jgi:hypothetical protein
MSQLTGHMFVEMSSIESQKTINTYRVLLLMIKTGDSSVLETQAAMIGNKFIHQGSEDCSKLIDLFLFLLKITY